MRGMAAKIVQSRRGGAWILTRRGGDALRHMLWQRSPENTSLPKKLIPKGGLITINIAEADDVVRENGRAHAGARQVFDAGRNS